MHFHITINKVPAAHPSVDNPTPAALSFPTKNQAEGYLNVFPADLKGGKVTACTCTA